MEINRDLFLYLSAALPYGVRGLVPIEVATGEYDIIDGSMIYDEVYVLVELTSITSDGDIEVISIGDSDPDLSDYNYTVDDFIPFIRPMENIPDDLRKTMVDKEFQIDWEIFRRRTSGDTTLDVSANVFSVQFLLENHYDCFGLIKKNLADAVTEENDPYKEV